MSKGIGMSKCSRQRKLAMLLSAAVAVIAVLMVRDQALAKPPLGKTWSASQRVSMNEIDHTRFTILLKKYVDSDGYVNYKAWKASARDRQALRNYLADLGRAAIGKPATRSARLAFWINAYNAVTLEGILQVFPTSSIRNHTARFVGYNIWKELPLRVDDQTFSLEQMEHRILRKMGEPRIHFAIVCASVSCPRLRNEAYKAENLERQLADNSTDFFSRRQNFRVDFSSRTIYVSSILDWFGSDFGRSQADRFVYLQRYLPNSARRLATDRQTTVEYLDYNWNLNDQSRKPASASRR